MLNMGEPILGYLNSHDRQRVVPDRAFHARLHGNPGLRRSRSNWHLDETIQSKIMAMVFLMATVIERGLISARTKEALCARRASGLPVDGRKVR